MTALRGAAVGVDLDPRAATKTRMAGSDVHYATYRTSWGHAGLDANEPHPQQQVLFRRDDHDGIVGLGSLDHQRLARVQSLVIPSSFLRSGFIADTIQAR